MFSKGQDGSGSAPGAAGTGDGRDERPQPESNVVEAAPVEHARLWTPWYRDWLLPVTVSTVLIADQVTKYVVKQNLGLYESWPAEGLIRITHGTNSGTIWGLFPNETFLLIVASFFAIGFLYYFYRSQAFQSRILRLAVGLQLGGAVGNLIDRIRLGEVVDFIDVGWWPVFNLADSSIVVGIAILLAIVWLGRDAPSESATSEGSEAPADADD